MKLTIEKLAKSYPTPAEPLDVLRDVNLSLSPPETLAILGPSGSGKSTLLNIIGTLDQPSSGQVLFDNENPFTLPLAQLAAFRNERTGFVFQDHHLLPQLTALENVLIPVLAKGAASKEQQAKAEQLLERVGLAQRRTHLPAELSGGERQRVAIARSLINKPAILLADEPTGNLDPRTAAAVTELLITLANEQGMLLVAVTHNPELAKRFSRILTMQDGRLT